MNIEDMTPEQIRAYAVEKERAKDALVSRYMDVPASPRFEGPKATEPAPYERDVEFEGETYRVDMRRTKSMRFVRLVGKMQEAAGEKGEPDISAVLDMYDYLFGGAVADKVAETVREKTGFDDFEETIRVYNALFEAVGAKN